MSESRRMVIGVMTLQLFCEPCSMEAEGAPTFTRLVVPDDHERTLRCVACGHIERWQP